MVDQKVDTLQFTVNIDNSYFKCDLLTKRYIYLFNFLETPSLSFLSNTMKCAFLNSWLSGDSLKIFIVQERPREKVQKIRLIEQPKEHKEHR